MTDDLVAFLRARLDEDEQAAQEAHYEGQRWLSEEEDVCRWPDDELVHIADRKCDARHIARWDPVRVLAEVQAKRRIIEMYENADAAQRAGSISERNRTQDEAAVDVLGEAVHALAAVYASHPDYRGAWSPDEVDTRGHL